MYSFCLVTKSSQVNLKINFSIQCQVYFFVKKQKSSNEKDILLLQYLKKENKAHELL